MTWKKKFGEGYKVHFCEIYKTKFRRKIYSPAACGQKPFRKGTNNVEYVTCKRCLKVLNKKNG